MTASTTTTTPRRADAQRNREKLLAAAVDLFSAGAASNVSLEAIAQRAGVGIGTLYRHFPTREALLEEAYRGEVAVLHEAAAELLADRPADQALAEWLARFVVYAATKRGMSPILQATAGHEQLASDSRAQLVDAVTTLLAAGAADGTLRTDVDAYDVLPAMSGIWMATEDPDASRAQRLIGLLMDGLRHRG
jgi:AcrR family transcriptional regulator